MGVDVGGTKTLLAVLDEHGVIKEEKKFRTPETYANFLLELKHTVTQLETKEFKAGAVGIRGMIDRKHGRRIGDALLDWGVVPVQADVEKITHCPIVLENDAKLAALSEGMLLKAKYSRVLYITISTGIGFALVVDGNIDSNINDGGGQSLLLEHKEKLTAWEDFAGGQAIVERYGKKAMDIHDAETWKKISRDLAKGISQLIAVMQPEVIVIGGSVGEYFDRYADQLEAEISKYKIPLVEQPDLKQAQRPNEAVVYGCYDIAKQVYGHASSHK